MIAFVSIIGQIKNLSQNPHPPFKNFKEQPINCNQKKEKTKEREKTRNNQWKPQHLETYYVRIISLSSTVHI